MRLGRSWQENPPLRIRLRCEHGINSFLWNDSKEEVNLPSSGKELILLPPNFVRDF